MTQEIDNPKPNNGAVFIVGLYFPVWAIIGAVAAGLWIPIGNPNANDIQILMVLLSGGAFGVIMGLAVLFKS